MTLHRIRVHVKMFGEGWSRQQTKIKKKTPQQQPPGKTATTKQGKQFTSERNYDENRNILF